MKKGRTKAIPEFRKLAKEIANICLEKKGENIVILDLEDLSILCDYFVIVTGDSEIQNRSITDTVREKLEERGISPHHVEGYEEGRWILVDYEGVILHLFTPELREYYDLERLWGDARREEWTPSHRGETDRGIPEEGP